MDNLFRRQEIAMHICIIKLKSNVMKTIKSLCLVLLVATGVLAQPNPSNMFIHGYVTDMNGGAVANQVVCADWASNSPALPSDSLCTTTNANGYYYLDITNGSVTGPNVTFTVSTYDPCSFLPLTQSVSNNQGTVDLATVDFTVCANSGGCDVWFTSTNDSVNGTWTFVADATGQAPFSYDWWVDGSSYSTQTVSHVFNGGTVGVFLTITDANGCSSMYGDTLYLDGNQGNCNADYTYLPNSNPNMPVTAGEAVQFTYTGTIAPFNYYFWSVQGGGISIVSYGQNPSFTFPSAGTYTVCVEVFDSIANCSDTYCETLTVQPGNSNACQAYFGWSADSLLGSPLPAAAFTDFSQNAASWFWDFGDNTFSTEQNPIHAYNGTGTYFVCLTIVSADQSCTNTYCDTVILGNSNTGGCNAAFSNSGPTPIGYTFTAQVQSQSPYYWYSWTVDNQVISEGSGNSEAYVPGLTNGVHTICLTIVDSLNMCSDTQCQTFAVGSNNCYGYISGQVYAGSPNYPLDAGVVYLITFDQNTNQLTAIDSMVVDSGNFYFFGPLACGDYLIKAAAYPGSQYYNNHIPTYYGNSPFWGFAQTVTLAQVNTQVTADVTLIASNNPGGPGFIGGDVTEGANKADLGDPLSGMQVMLFNLSGNAIACTYTNANGEFGFDDLAYGTYQVYVEQLGVQTIPAVVTIGANEPSVEDVHILVSESLISTGIEEFDFEGAISEVYPNPVLSEATITFNLESEVMVDVNVVDLTGRTISTQTVSISGGKSTVRISAERLNGGYYFLNIQDVDGTFSVTRKFMRVD
jgi:PKD repeat protein